MVDLRIAIDDSKQSQIGNRQSPMHFVLYSHETCPLCDRLESLIAPHLAAASLKVEKRNIKDSRDWLRAYRHRIPVLTCDDDVILEGNPSEDQVNTAMRAVLK